VTSDALRDHCLTFPGTEETFPFGPLTSVFKVAGKMFALSRLSASPLEISLKCEPGLAEQLRQVHTAVRPGYHLVDSSGRRNTIVFRVERSEVVWASDGVCGVGIGCLGRLSEKGWGRGCGRVRRCRR
jgi:hypothetical protein